MSYVNKGQIKREADFAINTIIGPDSYISGDIKTGGFTRIDGSVKGNLYANGRVVVGSKARMRSSITGTNITIGGIVDGNVLASECLVVLQTAMILGNITTRRIEAHDGCLIHGRVRVCENQESWERAQAEYRDKRPSANANAFGTSDILRTYG